MACVLAACASNSGLVAATGSGWSCNRSLAIRGFLPNTCWVGLRPRLFSISFLLLQENRMHCSNSCRLVGCTWSMTFWRITSNKWPCFSTLPSWLCASAAVLITPCTWQLQRIHKRTWQIGAGWINDDFDRGTSPLLPPLREQITQQLSCFYFIERKHELVSQKHSPPRLNKEQFGSLANLRHAWHPVLLGDWNLPTGELTQANMEQGADDCDTHRTWIRMPNELLDLNLQHSWGCEPNPYLSDALSCCEVYATRLWLGHRLVHPLQRPELRRSYTVERPQIQKLLPWDSISLHLWGFSSRHENWHNRASFLKHESQWSQNCGVYLEVLTLRFSPSVHFPATCLCCSWPGHVIAKGFMSACETAKPVALRIGSPESGSVNP